MWKWARPAPAAWTPTTTLAGDHGPPRSAPPPAAAAEERADQQPGGQTQPPPGQRRGQPPAQPQRRPRVAAIATKAMRGSRPASSHQPPPGNRRLEGLPQPVGCCHHLSQARPAPPLCSATRGRHQPATSLDWPTPSRQPTKFARHPATPAACASPGWSATLLGALPHRDRRQPPPATLLAHHPPVRQAAPCLEQLAAPGGPRRRSCSTPNGSLAAPKPGRPPPGARASLRAEAPRARSTLEAATRAAEERHHGRALRRDGYQVSRCAPNERPGNGRACWAHHQPRRAELLAECQPRRTGRTAPLPPAELLPPGAPRRAAEASTPSARRAEVRLRAPAARRLAASDPSLHHVPPRTAGTAASLADGRIDTRPGTAGTTC